MKRLSLALVTATFMLAGCGGGGGSSPAPTPTPTPTPTPVPTPTPTPSACSSTLQKDWVHDHLHDVYLWENEIVDVPADSYSTPEDYFYALLVKSKDHPWYATTPDETFSFTASQAEMDEFFQAGTNIGYGANFVAVGSGTSYALRVSYTEANSPASQQNMVRGATISKINGKTFAQMTYDEFIAALFPSQAGETNTFEITDAGAASSRSVTLTSATITTSPVLTSEVITAGDGKKIGYLVFNDHVATAETPLINTLQGFKDSGIDDLVLDVRYNGGGLLYIADEVASMIGGTATENKTFEKLQFNAKHPEKTNDPNNTLPFLTASVMDSTRPLPQLNLPRVFVLTSESTCSASESIINSLSPFVQVITIGGTTCGKPYGMIQTNNCSQAYFAIQFKGVNDSGYGDYAAGIAPTCAAQDDLDHPLGSTSERLLAAAIGYRTSNSCPMISFMQSRSAKYAPIATHQVYRAPWRENRIWK